MDRKELVEIITREVCRLLDENDSRSSKAIESLQKKTPARIGVGKAGPRLKTKTLLTLRADHARAKDAVYDQASDTILSELELFKIKTKCRDIEEHLTRPDLGRQLSEEARKQLEAQCIMEPQVQIYASDGLSGTAVNANIKDILPVLTEGLKDQGIKVGTPFYLEYGRVPAMDEVSAVLGAVVTCVLLGERPGLAAADSMSAYLAYKATPGMPESRRTVVSNIHGRGIQPVEAGAYLVEVILKMLEKKASGVELKL